MTSRSIRVGVDARTFFHAAPRGEGRAGIRLYQEMAKRRPAWTYIFYGDQSRAAPPTGLGGANFRSFSVPGYRWNSWMRVGLPAAAGWDKVNVLHCTSSGAPSFVPAPTVVTVHDVIPLLIDDGADRASIARFRRNLEAAVSRARALIAVSESTRQDLISLMGADPRIVHVVPWGADGVASVPSAAWIQKVKSELAIKREYVLAFGGDAPRKNTLGVVRGFARLATRLPEVELVVVGLPRGPVRDSVLESMRRLGIEDRVRLLPYIDDAQLEALYAHAKALLYLSLYEGFGLPALEAMSRGLPVVASNRSSLPEVVGDAGLLVDPDDEGLWSDSVAELLCSPGRLNVMADLGRSRASTFTWARTAEATADILQAAAG